MISFRHNSVNIAGDLTVRDDESMDATVKDRRMTGTELLQPWSLQDEGS